MAPVYGTTRATRLIQLQAERVAGEVERPRPSGEVRDQRRGWCELVDHQHLHRLVDTRRRAHVPGAVGGTRAVRPVRAGPHREAGLLPDGEGTGWAAVRITAPLGRGLAVPVGPARPGEAPRRG